MGTDCPQPLDDSLEGTVGRKLELHIRDGNPRRQVVLHLGGAHDPDWDGVVDLDPPAPGARSEVDAETGKATVALGELQDDHGGRG